MEQAVGDSSWDGSGYQVLLRVVVVVVVVVAVLVVVVVEEESDDVPMMVRFKVYESN